MAQLQDSSDVTEISATNVTEFTSAIVLTSRHFRNTRPWWRGQRRADWNLIPSLHRLGFATRETNLNARFRLMAKVRSKQVPDNTDPLGWLFLMQHYRLPTRLLDWSQSPLVALYFAVESPDDQDAMLWALSPTNLNLLEANTAAICMPQSKEVGKLGMEAFKREGDPKDIRVLAVLTEETDLRHMVQQSAFTVHGRGVPLDQRLEAQKFLLRIRIPRVAKEDFRQLLSLYGINRATLFPDLENLALELQGLEFENAAAIAELADESPISF